MSNRNRKSHNTRSTTRITERCEILWLYNIQVARDEKEVFIQHVVENYYMPQFKEKGININIKNKVQDLIDRQNLKNKQKDLIVHLPLIAGVDYQEGWIEHKENDKTYYYKPIPPMPDEQDEANDSAVDEAFGTGDDIIGRILSEHNISDEIRADLDSARDNEKQTYASLLASSKKAEQEKDKACSAELAALKKELQASQEKLGRAEEEKKRAVDESTKEWKEKYQGEKKSADNFKNKWEEERSERVKHEETIKANNQTIENLNQSLKRAKEESSLYTKCVEFYRAASGFAQRTVTFFDELAQLQKDFNQLKVNIPADVNADDYNYYLMRIERKFCETTSRIADLSEWQRELYLLARKGLVPTGGLIDQKIGGNKVSEQQWESTLRMLLYQTVMTHLAGAAVVMSDELALMLPSMVDGVKNTNHFANTTERLRKAINELGYDLNYVKPFTPLDSYKNVQNVEFTKADVPEGTIFEIIKMALNFGSSKSKTEVSAK